MYYKHCLHGADVSLALPGVRTTECPQFEVASRHHRKHAERNLIRRAKLSSATRHRTYHSASVKHSWKLNSVCVWHVVLCTYATTFCHA